MKELIYVLLISAFFIASILMLVRVVFFSQIKKNAMQTSADLKVWMLYQFRWSGQPNEVLYTWRKVLYELKDNQAPADQIEAAQRAVKYYERKLTKATWMVTSSGKLRTRTTIGGHYEI